MRNAEARRRSIARDRLRHELKSVISALEQLRPELEAISTNVKLELSAAAKCGEDNTSLSTCTKITTSTDPCDKTKPVGIAEPPSITIDLGELVRLIEEGDPAEYTSDEEAPTYDAIVSIKFQELRTSKKTKKVATNLAHWSLSLGPDTDQWTKLVSKIRNEVSKNKRAL